MKLELKHLAGYLPYRLNCYGRGEVIESTQYTENPINKLLTITGLDTDWVITTDDSIMMEDCIPILRTLLDLTKEIEVNSKKFVPMVRLAGLFHMNVIEYCHIEQNPHLILETARFVVIQKLLEWHFDIYGLIENGLAISIHDVKEAGI